MTGFEQVIRDNIPTYYAVDIDKTLIVTFDRRWRHLNISSLPYSNTFTLKYVEGYFYFSSNSYFYKTDSNFNLVSEHNSNVIYRGIYYHSTELFFVAASGTQEIHVFDKNCVFKSSLSTRERNFFPYAVNYLHGDFYVGNNNEYGYEPDTKVVVLKKSILRFVTSIWQVDCGGSSRVVSITFDSQGFMLLACEATHKVVLYDTNGNYLNSLQTSQYPYHTAIDYDGRLVIVTGQSLDIYY